MSNQKRDLTSIDDLGEFIHELNEEIEEEKAADYGSGEGEAFEDAAAFDGGFGSETGTAFEEAEESHLPPDFSGSFDESDAAETPFLSEDSAPAFRDPEPTLTKTEIPRAPAPERTVEATPPETFADLKTFGESTSFSASTVEGNPSFSVLLKNVRYIEDVNDILLTLKELGLLSDSEEVMKGRLMRGSLLVPRISEYAAILLAHRLRRFDIDIQVGLSDEIHPPKHRETPEVGIVSKYNLYQNQGHHFRFDDAKLDISQIIVAATPSLEGHQVLRYMGVASEHKIVPATMVENENSEELPRYYQELAQKLKAHALKASANAVVGLNYQLTPLPTEFGNSNHKYRLTCTGNLVWVNKV